MNAAQGLLMVRDKGPPCISEIRRVMIIAHMSLLLKMINITHDSTFDIWFLVRINQLRWKLLPSSLNRLERL